MTNNNSNNNSSLRLFLWNSNGLHQHKNKLETVLYDHKIDIALLTETHFTAKSIFKIHNYSLYRSDHPDGSAHAGSCILVSNSIQYNVLVPYQKPSIRATNISIKINNAPLTISSVYSPPCNSIRQEDYVNFFNSLGNSFIAGGDFNAKHPMWGCFSNNHRGKILHSVISNYHYSFVSPTGPTYWPTHSNRNPDILDFFVTNTSNLLSKNIENICDIASDHSPIILSVGGTPALSTRPSLTHGPIVWETFKTYLDDNIDLKISLKSTNEIEIAAQNLVKLITDAASNSTISTHQHQNVPKNILPIHLRRLINEKRYARSVWQRTHLPSDKTSYNLISNKLKKLLSKYKYENYTTYLQSLKTSDNSLWKVTKRLTKIKELSPPLLKENNTLAVTDIEKSILFGEHLESTFKNHQYPRPDPSHIDKVNNFLASPLPMSFPTKPISPGEISSIIKKLPIGKAPGYDLITNKVLKNVSKKGILLLTFIYNSMLRLSYFPAIWKIAVVILILKVGKLKKKGYLRIRPILSEHSILPNTQFGFRSKHSTLHQVHRLTDTIASALENKKFCTGLFLDIAQAFDKVWHNGLLFKLKQFMPAPLYLILKSYLEHRKFKVRHGNAFSPLFNIEAGGPQGSDLSPDLYNIFTMDIPKTVNTLLATFADDTPILLSNSDITITAQHLQEHLNLIDNWANNWMISINESKSSQVTFALRPGICPTIKLKDKKKEHLTLTSKPHILSSIKVAYREAAFPIIPLLKEAAVANVAFNQEVVRHLIDITLFLGRHSLPFRGYREGWDENAVSCCSEARDIFGNLEILYTFMGSSKKRTHCFTKHQELRYPGEPLRRLKRVETTRWSSHSSALITFFCTYEAIVDALNELKNDSTTDRVSSVQAEGLLHYLFQERFLLTALCFKNIFDTTSILSKCIQTVDINLLAAINYMQNCLAKIKKFRCDEEFNKLLEEKEIFFESKEDITFIPLPSKRVRRVKIRAGETSSDESIIDPIQNFKINVYFTIVDIVITQISDRFNDHSVPLFKDLALFSYKRLQEVAKTSYISDDDFKAFCDVYSHFV
ncbi:hypothetical protein QTP88_020124 [Uroleucon formosanum]